MLFRHSLSWGWTYRPSVRQYGVPVIYAAFLKYMLQVPFLIDKSCEHIFIAMTSNKNLSFAYTCMAFKLSSFKLVK